MNTARAILLVTLLAATSATVCRQGFCRQNTEVVGSYEVPVLLAIKQRNLDTLEKTFWDVSDPKSDTYGKYLSHKELSDLTSNPKGAAAVIAYLISHGVNNVVAKAHGDFVRMHAPIRTVERLFAAKYHVFAHEVSGKILHRSLTHTVPAEIAEHVDFVAHVSDFPALSGPIVSTPTPTPTAAARGNLRSAAAAAPTTTPIHDALVTPSVILDAYGVENPVNTAPENSMAVFEVGQNYAPSDLAMFLKQYDIPAETVAHVIGPNDPSICAKSPGACGEASLDVQYIIGVARNVSLTFWAMPTKDTTPFYDWIMAVAADANPPLVHSMSYGEIEQLQSPSLLQRTNTEFQKMGVRGLSIMISSGDDGVANYAAREGSQYCGFNPSFPASSPYVTAVGATQFKDGNVGDGQIPCQHNNAPPSLITTGGGFSSIFAAPSYQSAFVQQYLSTASLPPTSNNATQFPSPGFNKAGRGYPDVAALGHNYQVVIGGHTYSVDGTSCAAPVVAAMVALVNTQRLELGLGSLGFLNPALYNLAAFNPGAFTDIATGNNRCTASAVCCTNGFNGAAGWDPLTGLGTFNFQLIAAGLVA